MPSSPPVICNSVSCAEVKLSVHLDFKASRTVLKCRMSRAIVFNITHDSLGTYIDTQQFDHFTHNGNLEHFETNCSVWINENSLYIWAYYTTWKYVNNHR